MALLRKYGGRLRLVDGALKLGCCCNPCDCDISPNRPTADFSYTQTGGNASACTISLHDESLPGDCGPIVSWQWTKNGSPFSTSQNPTGVSVVDGDDIELTVTNAGGCNDAAVMEVQCNTLRTCCGCVIPGYHDIIMSGWGNDDCANGTCSALNGTHTLDLVVGLPGCNFLKTLSVTNCTGAGADGPRISTIIGLSGAPVGRCRIRASVEVDRSGGFNRYCYQADILLASLCGNSHVLSFIPFVPGPCTLLSSPVLCVYPSTVTVVIP